VAITLVEPREHRLLRNIEHLTKQRIEVATIPTVADLRARKLELTSSSLRETLVAGELDRYRVIVDSLSTEFDIVEIALAAVKLAHEATGGERGDEEEIPVPSLPPRGAPGPSTGKTKVGPRLKKKISEGAARLFVGAGRIQGIRPSDLVGAIANETGLPGRAIGAIEITDRFSVVELPADSIDQVIERLQGRPIKGKKVVIRRDRDGS
jgi:ATP-dependent RNA helicase DeaD